MAVSFVAGTDFLHGEELYAPLTAPAPTGLADDDMLLAFLYTRSSPVPPAGWTLVVSSTSFNQNGAGLNEQWIHVYAKDTVTAGDSGDDFDWDQADNELRIGVFYGAFRDADAVIDTDESVANNLTTYIRTPPTITATDNGQMLICIGSTIFAPTPAVSPTFPSSFTRFSGDSLTGYRLAAAYRAVSSGQSNSGDIDMGPGQTLSGAETTGLGTLTLLISSLSGGALPGWVAAPSPLGAPAILGRSIVAGTISVPSPLGAPSLLGYFDLAPYVADKPPARFVMDLQTPDGLVRIPISSWQATLQTGAAQYLNCVIPSPEQWVDAIGDATYCHIAGIIELKSGATTEYALASAPLQTVQYARGGTNYSATLSGYTPAPPDVVWPENTARVLRGVRTVFSSASGQRVRCTIDWSLRPGQLAILDGIPFTVAYINYSVSDGDQSMDVGERAA